MKKQCMFLKMNKKWALRAFVTLCAFMAVLFLGCKNTVDPPGSPAYTTVDALDLTAPVTAPVKDAVPVTTAIDHKQYTGTIAWQTISGAAVSGNFAPATVYKAIVTLSAKTGYAFTGVAANAFTHTGAPDIAGVKQVTNAANSGTVTITFPATAAEDTVVNALNLTAAVTAPVKNVAPIATAIDQIQYTGTIAWQTDAGAAVSGNFASATVYKAVVTLAAKPGYTFTGIAANAFTHNGAPDIAGVKQVTNAVNTGTVTITFPATAAEIEDTIVNALSLDSLVTAPVKNTAPVTTAINETQYTGTIAWQTNAGGAVSGNFGYDAVYKAVVTLTAKTDYTFTGVAANAFAYTGATTVTNAADSGTVTITFPATAPQFTVVNALNLTALVTAPVKGAAPVSTAINETQYTGSIAWKTAAGTAFSGNFLPETVYKAVVTLSVKADYTFTGVGANAFSYTGATTVTNAANSGTVTITFQATAAAVIGSHLEVLGSLGVNTSLSTTRNDGNNKPVPETAGPMGNRVVRAKREIFTAGYYQHNAYHLLDDWASGSRSDLINSNPPGTVSAWGTYPKKSAAADLDGDGLDEIVVVYADTSTEKIGLSRGKYAGGAISWTQATAIDYTKRGTATLASELSTAAPTHFSHTRMQLTAGDFNGDGKSELILVVAHMVYILDSNLSVIKTINTLDLIGDYPHTYFVAAAVADFDADGKDEFVLMIGRNDIASVASYYIYDDRSASFAELTHGFVTSGSTSLKVGNVAAGNFSGGSLPDIAFYGERPNDRYLFLMVLKTSMDGSSRPKFDFMNLSGNQLGINGVYINPMAAGDVDGDGRDDLFFYDSPWHLNGNAVERVPGTGAVVNADFYDVAMGDINGDGRDDVVVFSGGGYIRLYYNNGTQYKNEIYLIGGDLGSLSETGCLPNVDNDGFVLEYVRHDFQYTEPQVIAVLASAPYIADINEDGGGATYWGKSSSGGSSSEHSGSFSVGVSVGIEAEFSFFGLGATGLEVEEGLNSTTSWSFASTMEWEESWGYETPQGEDMVVYTSIPFDIYVYKVLSAPPGGPDNPPYTDATNVNHPNGLQAGDYTSVSYPRQPQINSATLPVYNSRVPANLRVSVQHTLGDPGSYYSKANRNSFFSTFGNTKGMFSSTELTVGEGNGTTTISRSVSTGTEKGFSEEVEYSASAKVKAGGVSAGASVAFGYGYSTTTSVGTGTEIAGVVANIPDGGLDNDHRYGFKWGLMAFPQTQAGSNLLLVTYYTDGYNPPAE